MKHHIIEVSPGPAEAHRALHDDTVATANWRPDRSPRRSAADKRRFGRAASLKFTASSLLQPGFTEISASLVEDAA